MTTDIRAHGLRFGRMPADETVPVRQIGQWALVWQRFSRHRLAFWSMRLLFVLVAVAIIGPMIAPPIPADLVNQVVRVSSPPRLWPFDLRYLMGTAGGVPVATYVLGGARYTLEIGVIGALVASIVGSLIGATAAYFGRYVDALLMRVVDAILTVPFLPLLMVIGVIQTANSALTWGLVFGFVGWPQVARLVRGNVLSLRQREFADAARALGATDIRVILRHFIPNTLDIVIVATTLNVALFVLADISLEFVEPSVAGSNVTWAQAFGLSYIGHWWTLVFPAIFLLMTVLAVNFVGDGLRDALDVQSGQEIGELRRRPHLEARLLSASLAGARFALAPIGALLASPPAVSAKKRASGWATSASRSLDRILPSAGRDTALSRFYRSAPVWFGIAPIVLLLLAGEVVMLYSHSPLIYAPNFPNPTTYASVQAGAPFDVASAPHGRWDLLVFDKNNALQMLQVDSAGKTLQRVPLVSQAAGADVSLAVNGTARLAAWVSTDTTRVQAGLVTGSHARILHLNPGGGLVEHPYAFSVPGGFEVVYSWQPVISGGPIEIYGSFISTTGNVSPPRMLVASKRHGLFVHGLTDARGRIDLWWMDYRGNDFWNWMFQRFTPSGRPLGKPLALEQVQFAPFIKNTKTQVPDAVPSYWIFSDAVDPHGNIWVAWTDDRGSSISEWSRQGTLTYPPTSLQGGGAGTQGQTLPTTAYSLAPTARGFQLYSGSVSLNDNGYIYVQGYDANANPIAPFFERTDYTGGGAAVSPQAIATGGKVYVFWDKARIGAAEIAGTQYGPKRQPDLMTRLGLNVGNPWVNALLVVGGSLGAGIAFGLANILIVLLLLAIWGVISIVIPRRLRRPVYGVMLTLVLAWLFNPSASLPGWVFIIHGIGWPGGWIAALGGAFVGIWSGLFLFRRFESVFRAVSIAFISVFFVATLYAVTVIQGQITQI